MSSAPNAPTRLFRKREACAWLSVSESQFDRYVHAGKLRVIKFGRRCLRVGDDELQRFAREHMEIA